MRILTCLLALIALSVVGCETNEDNVRILDQEQRVASEATEAPEANGETIIALDKVPEVVRTAGENAVPGLVITRVERDVEDGVVVYDVLGTAKGKTFEVEVTADGKVLEIEEEDDDDDDDDDDGEREDDD